MFFGPKITTVFTSRWKALFWSAGILVSAYSLVPEPDANANANDEQAQNGEYSQPKPVSIDVPFIGKIGGDQTEHPKSPWAADTASSTPQ